MAATLTSIEPATGETLWTGEDGDVDAEVAAARAAWAGWAARPFAVRVETLRRFANVVRGKIGAVRRPDRPRDRQAALGGARPRSRRWSTRSTFRSSAYAERTAQRRLEGAMGARVAVRHKPHGVLAVLGPYNFPAHLPNGHIVPALLAGNAVRVQAAARRRRRSATIWSELYHEAGVPEGVVRCVQGGAEIGKALAAHPGIDGLLFTGSARAGARAPPAVRRDAAQDPRARNGRQQPARRLGRARTSTPPPRSPSSPPFMSAGQRCTAARRLIVEDGAARAADRRRSSS